MQRVRFPAIFGLAFALGACSGSESGGGLERGDAGGEDVERLDAAPRLDSGAPAPDSGAPSDSGRPADAGAPEDAGMRLPEELSAGSHVQVAEARIEVGGDSFSSVVGKLGAGARSAANGARSYEWTLSGGVELTVWFANTNLDADDAAPADVDSSDRVLWIAVQGGFGGRTPEGIGLGSEQAAVGAAYGPAPREVTVSSPPGSLAQYFERGIHVGYAPDATVRTLTVARAYPEAPDGSIDPVNARLSFDGGPIQGSRGLGSPGTPISAVVTLLGEPDGRGFVTISGFEFETLSYAFIGIEVFGSTISGNTSFVSLHAPYYGEAAPGVGIGARRNTLESHLTSIGYGPGVASNTNASFLCYSHSTQGVPMVGISYSSAQPPEVTSITLPLLACP